MAADNSRRRCQRAFDMSTRIPPQVVFVRQVTKQCREGSRVKLERCTEFRFTTVNIGDRSSRSSAADPERFGEKWGRRGLLNAWHPWNRCPTPSRMELSPDVPPPSSSFLAFPAGTIKKSIVTSSPAAVGSCADRRDRRSRRASTRRRIRRPPTRSSGPDGSRCRRSPNAS